MRGSQEETGGSGFPELIGKHPSVLRLQAHLQAVARRRCTVIITGESGSGKEVAARQLHKLSPRCDKPFVTVDCTTLRDTLLESQLFGHVKGAFTGASHDTTGLFRSAEGGMLFLDEVGELELPIQAKLLRCIQDGAVVPLGAVDPIPVDVQIVAATNRNLAERVRCGCFREDLYFRLNVVQLEIPSLRKRGRDIPELARYFLAEHAKMYREPVKSLSKEAIGVLLSYSWPGNVRELRNVIEQALVFCDRQVVAAEDLMAILKPRQLSGAGRAAPEVLPLQLLERRMIKRALRASGGNQTEAASLLGIERHRLARLMRRYGIGRRKFLRSSTTLQRAS